MASVYTLKVAKTGNSSVLNGKLLRVRFRAEDKCIAFVDFVSNEVLWLTTPMKQQTYTEDGIRITTRSGSEYDLINVMNLLPTTAIEATEDKTAKVEYKKPTIIKVNTAK